MPRSIQFAAPAGAPWRTANCTSKMSARKMCVEIQPGDTWRFTLRNIFRVSFPGARFALQSSPFPGSIVALSRREVQMTSILSRDQIETYERDGFVHPIRIMSTDEARQMRAGFEELETLIGRRVEY